MILEVANLNIKPGQEEEFEAAFGRAQGIIASMGGYMSHQLQHSIEEPGHYLLLVKWQTLEDHTLGFRESTQYGQWRQLLHHFYDPFPDVQHYEVVFENIS